MKISSTRAILASAPASLMLTLFYTLAIHMHQTLGAWPTSIGEHGFPTHLVIHASIAMYVQSALVLSIIFLLPPALVLCAVVHRWRHLLPYLGIYVMSCAVSAALMQLAPARFLYWWWD